MPRPWTSLVMLHGQPHPKGGWPCGGMGLMGYRVVVVMVTISIYYASSMETNPQKINHDRTIVLDHLLSSICQISTAIVKLLPFGTLGTFKIPHECSYTTGWTINPSSCKHWFFIHYNFICNRFLWGIPRSFVYRRMGHCEWMAWIRYAHESTPSIHITPMTRGGGANSECG